MGINIIRWYLKVKNIIGFKIKNTGLLKDTRIVKTMKKNSGILTFFLSIFIFGFLIFKPAFSQDAALIPPAVQQFFDSSGNPLASGKVYFYQVGTSTFKDVYNSSAATTSYTNPITLNAGGKPPGGSGIYGIGLYRQLVKDKNGNTIWDAVTAPGGGSGGSVSSIGDGNAVGTVLPWSGLIAPNQYVFTYGQEIVRATYPEFFAAITLQANVICTTSSNTLTGIADTTQIPIGAPVELALCVPAGTTVISKTSGTVTLNNPANVSLNSTARFFPYGNGNGSTTFNVPDLRDMALVGRPNMGGTDRGLITSQYFGINPAGLGIAGGSQSHTQTISEMAIHNHTITVASTTQTASLNGLAASSSVRSNSNTSLDGGVTAFQTNTYGGGFQTGITFQPHTHDATSTITGASVPFSIIQPSITFNYIIKVTPDTPMSTETVVTELGGMTGVISCGTGLTCADQTISVNSFGEATTAIKIPVKAATTVNIGLFGAQTIDGVSVVAGDRVLVKNQSTASENGIYVVSNSNWTRATDFNEDGEVAQGTQVNVGLGTQNQNTIWNVSNNNPIIINSSSINFRPNKSQGQVSIIEFGGNPNLSDNSTALSAALAYVSSLPTCGRIYFPKGKYQLSTSISFTMPNKSCGITLEGDGQGATYLNWFNDTDGLSFVWSNQQNSIHIRNMNITTDSTSGTRFGLAITNSNVYGGFQEATQNDITGVTFQGNTGIDATKYWGTAVYIQAVSYVSFTNTLIYGGFSGPTPSGRGVVLTDYTGVITANFNFTNCSLIDLDIGILTSNNPQGLIVNNSTFIDSNFGIATLLGSNPIVGIQIANSNFANYISNIYLQTEVNDLIITGNQFYTNDSPITSIGETSVVIAKVARFSITGNNFLAVTPTTNTTGISILDTQGWSGSIASNTFNGQYIVGLNLGVSTSLIKAYPNSYGTPLSSGPTTAYINNGTDNNVIAPVKDGGMGISSGTSGGIPYFSSTSTIASSNLLIANGILLGGGAGGAPITTAAMTNGQLLVGQTSSSPLPKTLSGDGVLNSSGSLTVNKVNGVVYPSSPSINTIPVVISSNTVAYSVVPNSALANSSLTIGSTNISLGSTATTISGLTLNSPTITKINSETSTSLQLNGSNGLGELKSSGTTTLFWNGVGFFPNVDNAYQLGDPSIRFNKIYGTTFYGGSGVIGLSKTYNVRAAGGASDCTIIVTGGIVTGGTC